MISDNQTVSGAMFGLLFTSVRRITAQALLAVNHAAYAVTLTVETRRLRFGGAVDSYLVI